MRLVRSFLFLGLFACGSTIDVGSGGDGGSGGTSSGNTSSGTSGSTSGGTSGSGGIPDGGSLGCSPFATPPCPAGSGTQCVDGYCLIPTASTCRLADDGNDACDSGAICRDVGAAGPTCFVAPACPSNGICPTPGGPTKGGGAATCNTGALKSKGRICIPDRCQTNADCSGSFVCVRKKVSDVLGYCEPGGVSLQSDGNGAGWENAPGCEVTPSVLVGTGAPGSVCNDPVQCAPTCCSCQGGGSAALAAKCTFGTGIPLKGTCASAADACAAVMVSSTTGTCKAP